MNSSYDQGNQWTVEYLLVYLFNTRLWNRTFIYIDLFPSSSMLSFAIVIIGKGVNNNAMQHMSDYDPLYLLPPIKYEEFVFKLNSPEGANVAQSFNK